MEFFDVVDKYGNPTGEIVSREAAHAEGILHRTSHVWLWHNNNGVVEILLQKRCMTKDSFPGCYDISSAGHIPAGCDFVESAVRELYEELGVKISGTELVYCGDITISNDNIFHGMEFHDRQFSRVFALEYNHDENSFALQADEVESVMWIGLCECIKAVRNNSIPNCIYISELELLKSVISLRCG